MTVEELALRLSASRAGRAVSPDVVRGAAAWALERHKPKEAEKAAKTRLHQLYGSYIVEKELDQATDIVAALERGERDAPSAAQALLPLHGSTRERLPELQHCYDTIWQVCGAPRRVADIACGFNPLSFFALGRTEFELAALDAGQELVTLLNRFFAAAGQDGFHAKAGDALAAPTTGHYSGDAPTTGHYPGGAPTTGHYDLALIFKFLPLAERLRRGGARALLDSLDARHIVVSFPTRTLGGRNVGMEGNYAQWFHTLGYPGKVLHSFCLSNELFLIVEGR